MPLKCISSAWGLLAFARASLCDTFPSLTELEERLVEVQHPNRRRPFDCGGEFIETIFLNQLLDRRVLIMISRAGDGALTVVTIRWQTTACSSRSTAADLFALFRP